LPKLGASACIGLPAAEAQRGLFELYAFLMFWN